MGSRTEQDCSRLVRILSCWRATFSNSGLTSIFSCIGARWAGAHTWISVCQTFLAKGHRRDSCRCATGSRTAGQAFSWFSVWDGVQKFMHKCSDSFIGSDSYFLCSCPARRSASVIQPGRAPRSQLPRDCRYWNSICTRSFVRSLAHQAGSRRA